MFQEKYVLKVHQQLPNAHKENIAKIMHQA